MTDPYGGNLTFDVLDRLVRPDEVALARRIADGDGVTWREVTIGEFHTEVTALAKGLIAAGIEPGDRVLLLSRTRYEWTLADYAIWWCGAVTVPVYETAEADQVAHVLADSGARAAIVEGPSQAALVRAAQPRLPLWQLERGGIEELTAAGATIADSTLTARRESLGPESLATIVYTSGTTTTPKGCMLTHGNFRAEVASAIEALPELFAAENASTLLVLPLPHVFARIVQIGAIRSGTTLGHSSRLREIQSDLQSFSPTFVLAVPRLFERLFNTASTTAYAEGKGRLFDAAARAAIDYSQSLERPGKPGLLTRSRHRAFERLVYDDIRSAFGGRADFAVSGGAPLGERLNHFFRGIGIPVLEGYGLTETTAAIAVNSPTDGRIGSVGRPLPRVDVRLADDGELQVRGPQVFAGYWNDEEATTQVFDDGWLSTGDLAEIDGDGFVHIVARKKEVLVTAGGKAVAPGALEDRVCAHPVVSQCLVVGDGKPWLAALVTIDRLAWTGSLDDPDLRKRVQSAIDDANQQVAPAESIRAFTILAEEWSVDNGYLTPSFKIKRRLVTRDLHDRIEALFLP